MTGLTTQANSRMAEVVMMEATAAVFDGRAVDSWAGGRRRMLPIAGGHVPGALEELPGAEEWVGGGATLLLPGEAQARRVVWRARGHSTWLAEFAAGRDLPRNGMQLPHGVLSRDALCLDAAPGASGGGGDATVALLWTLSPNLVLRCVAYRRPHALPLGGGGGRGAAAAEPPPLQGAAATGGATGGLGSLFDPLPRNEQAEALALRPAAGSDYPSCCAFVVGGGGKGGQQRHLVVGYPTGKIQLLQLHHGPSTATPMDAGGDGGAALGGRLDAEVVKEFPASGMLSYLNPLSYRATAQVPASPVVAVAGRALDGGGGVTGGGEADFFVFSLHADRKLRIWAAKGKGTALHAELSLPGALDRGLVYAGCSKVAVVPLPGGGGGYRLLVSLTEPSHSRIWVSQPFRTGADLAGMGDAALAAHIVEAPCLVADALLLPSNQPHRGGSPGSPLRLWAALTGGDGDGGGGGSSGSLAYVDLPATVSPQPLRLSRLWEPPSDHDGGSGAGASASAAASAAALLLLPSPREAATTLAARPLPAGAGVGLVGASAGSAFSGSKGGSGGSSSSREGALRQQLWALHQQLLPSSGSGGGSNWPAVHRHIDAGFLRLLTAASPHRHSPLGLTRALERFVFSSSTATAATSGTGGGGRAGSPVPPSTSGGGGGDEVLVGERLCEAIVAAVRREGDAEAERRRLQQGPQGPQTGGASALVDGERRARALFGAWLRFVGVAEGVREVLGQPLGLVAPVVAETEGKEDPVLAGGPLVVRVDRATVPTPLPLPLPPTPTLHAFSLWLQHHAPHAPYALTRRLAHASAHGLLPDPAALSSLAATALARRPGLEAGLLLSPSTVDLSDPATRAAAVAEVGAVVAAVAATAATGVAAEQGQRQQQSSTPASMLTATVLASAAHAALRFTLSRARAAVLLLADLESLGLLPAACLLPPTDSSNSSHPSPHAAALALNRAWLLLATCSQPQLPPSPPRPPSPSSANQASGGGGAGGKRSHLTLHGKGLTVLEALMLQQGGGSADGSALLKGWLAAGPASSLPRRLLAFLEGTDQWRYLAPWAQAHLHRALPSPAPAPSDGDERMWERHIVYAHLSEARRHAAAQRPRAADAALGRAVACLRRWERCLCPILPGEGVGMGEGEGPVDGGDVRQQRVAHYVQAIALLEQQQQHHPSHHHTPTTTTDTPGRRLADTAYAGLREILPLVSGDTYGEDEAAAVATARWALRQAAALWAAVFRACTDTTTTATTTTATGGGSTVVSSSSFEEAFLAMRAEGRVGAELRALGQQQQQEAAAVAVGRNKNSKLTFLLGELCERGRLDLVCALPWGAGQGGEEEDEVAQIQDRMRTNARFSAVEGVDGEEDGVVGDAMAIGGGSLLHYGGSATDPPPVDYYRASYAFLVQQGNHQQAAADMYRLVQRLEGAAAYEDSLPRLNRKIEALSTVHNALSLLRHRHAGPHAPSSSASASFPFFHFMHEDRFGTMNTPNAPKRVMSAITLPRVAQELAYAVACRHYLEATTHHNLTHLPPLRPLGLAPVPPLPKGADPLAAAGAGGDDDARRQRAAGQQAATAAGLLCRVGLYESAANLLRAFGLPMTPVVQGLARAVVVLRGRRGGDWPMVGEDGVGWEVGVDEEGATAEEKRRAAFLRLAGVEMEGEGEEEIGAAKGGEAAAWLLRDVVQRWDWAHAFGLHVEAARWMLAADSFAALPRWLVCAFTRGVEAHLLVPSTQRNANKKQRPNNNNSSAYTDQEGARRVAGAADAGAFLAMHVDKAVYLLQQAQGQGQGHGAGGGTRVGGVMREALHLLVAALGYAKDTVDTAVEQLHKVTITSSSSSGNNNKQTCLPRTQLTALVVRTREALRLSSALPPPLPEGVGALVAAAEEGLTTLGKVFRVYDGDVGDAEASLGVAAAVAAAIGDGDGGGGLGGVVAGGGDGGGGFRFG